MPLIHGRSPIASDFEDISLFDPKDIRKWRAQRDSQSSQESTSSELALGLAEDAHASFQSLGSNISTPTLASDTSSLRSSMCSLSSPVLAVSHQNGNGGAPTLPTIHPAKHHHNIAYQQNTRTDAKTQGSLPQQKGIEGACSKPYIYARRRSVPALMDNTSMASLTIKAQSSCRTRKQREREFEEDQDDDIWPGDSLMFNVPMSPALYAQQRQRQHQSVPSTIPYTSQKAHTPNNGGKNLENHPSMMHQQMQMPSRNVSGISQREQLPSIHENNDTRKLSSSASAIDLPHDFERIQSRVSSVSTLPSLMSRRGSYASDPLNSIDGLDSDASDLTLELCRLDQEQNRSKRESSKEEDLSYVSIASLAMIDSDEALPTPNVGDDGEPKNSRDSRRSSLTRPDNLPPKSPEEERKHLKEYEKMVKDATAAEKRKQQKREAEAKLRDEQAIQDYGSWSYWLSKKGKARLNSDIKWRGVPIKLRAAVWSQMASYTKPEVNLSSFPLPNTTYRLEIIRDSEKLWPDCCIFGQGRPLHDPLLQVVEQFLSLKPEISYKFALTGIAGLLLLHLSERDSIFVMTQLIKKNGLVHAILSGNERLASANYISFERIFRKKFESLNKHFAKVGLDHSDFLNPMISNFFTTTIPSPEGVARILDVFWFDGDSLLLRAALGILRINEAWLYGSKEEILEELHNTRVSTDDELINAIRNVTKS